MNTNDGIIFQNPRLCIRLNDRPLDTGASVKSVSLIRVAENSVVIQNAGRSQLTGAMVGKQWESGGQ